MASTAIPVRPTDPATDAKLRDARFAVRLSLIVGVAMLVGKLAAYFMTRSAAVFSDAAESVVHIMAVAFAAFSLRLSARPARPTFLYGYERIVFFSAGFEGAMIMVAALVTLIEAIRKWMVGLELENLSAGALLVAAAGLVNAALGVYLLRVGRRSNSIILEADGKHVLTDSWTSAGVVASLGLVVFTGWRPFDPLIAIAIALNILWSGGLLVWRAAAGLLDYSDPKMGRAIRNKLDAICSELHIEYHGVRFRTTGYRQMIEVHLLFPRATPLSEAHGAATILEERLSTELGIPAEVVTHLECLEDHADVHHKAHYTGKPS